MSSTSIPHQLDSPVLYEDALSFVVPSIYTDFAVIDDDHLQMIEAGSSSLPTVASEQEEIARKKIKELAKFGRARNFKATGGVKMAFPNKLMEVLSRGDLNEIICWMPHGRAFKVQDAKKCTEVVLPRFFKQTQYHSFIRQLNLWGFNRITHGPDEGAYYHEMFLRGRPNLAMRLVRHKVKGTKPSRNRDGEPNLYKFSAMSGLSPNRFIPSLPPLSTDVARITKSVEDVQTKATDGYDVFSSNKEKEVNNSFSLFVQGGNLVTPVAHSPAKQDKLDQTGNTVCTSQWSGFNPTVSNEHILPFPRLKTQPRITWNFSVDTYQELDVSDAKEDEWNAAVQRVSESNQQVEWNVAVDYLEEKISPLEAEKQNELRSNDSFDVLVDDLFVNDEPFSWTSGVGLVDGRKEEHGNRKFESNQYDSTVSAYRQDYKDHTCQAQVKSENHDGQTSWVPYNGNLTTSSIATINYETQLNCSPFAVEASLSSNQEHDSSSRTARIKYEAQFKCSPFAVTEPCSSNQDYESTGESFDGQNPEATQPARQTISTNLWEDRFEELKAYKRETGHSNVPKIYSKNPSLGYWVQDQRSQYRRFQAKKSSDLTEDKIKALDSLGFKWGSWHNWLKELETYKREHGNVDVPLKYKPNVALGAFVSRQRTEYRKLQQGQQSTLNDQRIHDLEALGFRWSVRVSRTRWEDRLKELKEFKAQYGHTNVPSIYPENQPLAYWIFKQRGQYRAYMDNIKSKDNDEKVTCHITPERIAMLDELGFEWNPPGRIKLTPNVSSTYSKDQCLSEGAAKKGLPRSNLNNDRVKHSVEKANLLGLDHVTLGENAQANSSQEEQSSFRKCEIAFLSLIGKLVKAKNDRNVEAFNEIAESINRKKDMLPPSFLRTYQLETLMRYASESFESA